MGRWAVAAVCGKQACMPSLLAGSSSSWCGSRGQQAVASVTVGCHPTMQLASCTAVVSTVLYCEVLLVLLLQLVPCAGVLLCSWGEMPVMATQHIPLQLHSSSAFSGPWHRPATVVLDCLPLPTACAACTRLLHRRCMPPG